MNQTHYQVAWLHYHVAWLHYQVAWLHYQVARLPDCNAFNFYPLSLLKVNKGPVINYGPGEGKVQHRVGGKCLKGCHDTVYPGLRGR